MSDITVIKQEYHRNGIGGTGFIISYFIWNWDKDKTDVFIGFTPMVTNNKEEMAVNTGVVRLNDISSGILDNCWRGADYCGKELVRAWFEDRNGYSDSLSYLRNK